MENEDLKIKEEAEPQYCIICGNPLYYTFEIKDGICEDCMIDIKLKNS